MGTLKQNGDLLGTQNRKNVPHGEQCLWVPVSVHPSNSNSLIDSTDVTLVDEDINLILANNTKLKKVDEKISESRPNFRFKS